MILKYVAKLEKKYIVIIKIHNFGVESPNVKNISLMC